MVKYINNEEGVRLSMLIQSHLTDALIGDEPADRITFVKWCIGKSEGNLTHRVDAEMMWNDFKLQN